MALSIADTATRLKQAARSADLNGNGTLGTQELKSALKQGILTVAEKNMLARVSSEAGNSRGGLTLANYDRWVDRFAQVAVKADALSSSPDSMLTRAEAARSPNVVNLTGATVGAARTMLDKYARVSATSALTPAVSPQPLSIADIDAIAEMWNSIEQAVTP